MKTFGNVKSSGFGFAVVAAGQRNMTADPQVIATSTEGGFRITCLLYTSPSPRD